MTQTFEISPKLQETVKGYETYSKGHFAPLPISVVKSKGSKLWDEDNKEYIDFLCMFSVTNMGHSHPKILAAYQKTLAECPIANMAVLNPLVPKLGKLLCETFNYDKFIEFNGGSEANDAALKIARKWGYEVKNIHPNDALIITGENCYHGCTIATQSLQIKQNPSFGPLVPNVGTKTPDGKVIRYGVIEDIEIAFQNYSNQIAAVMFEPIQGAAGTVSPPKGYLKAVYDLCKQYNILFIADEVQTGFGRTGYPLSHQSENFQADIVTLGKALGGGVAAVSGVLGTKEVMKNVKNSDFGATMAGNPPGMAAAIAATQVLFEEKLSERSLEMGKVLVDYITKMNPPHVKGFDGSGLFLCVIIDEKPPKVTGRRICALAIRKGLVVTASSMLPNRIRLSPPLNIPEEELLAGADILIESLKEVESTEGHIPGELNTQFL